MDTLTFTDALDQLKKQAAELVAAAQSWDEVSAATYLVGQIAKTKVQLQDGYKKY